MFLELLKKYQEQYQIRLFAYALLPDHLHLLVDMTSKSQVISDFMHDLNNSYTKYFNGRNQRKGHLFRERFKAALIEKDENYLLKMTAYIHLNPEKLKYTADARQYPYSSYKNYLNQAGCVGGIDIKDAIAQVQSLLVNKDYSQFVQELTDEEAESIHKRLQRGGILGSDDFVKRVKNEVENYQAQSDDEEAGEAGPKNYKLFIMASSVILVLVVCAGAVYFYLVNLKPKDQDKKTVNSVVPVESPKKIKTEEWQIRLQPTSGGNELIDTLILKDGKFTSRRLNFMGFSSSNYSLSVDNKGKTIWETMQSSSTATASWRGEIEFESMQGILSLREEGKPAQDFSFVSVSFKKE